MPDAGAHHVCVTIDFDASSGFIASGQTTPTPVSRGEFDAVAYARLLRLFDRFDIRSTWFATGAAAATYPHAIEQVAAAGHEIGNHGWSHRAPADLEPEDEERELVETNALLERLSGRRPRGFRSPSWDLSAKSVELLERYGFLYDSSMMGDDYTPYRARTGDQVMVGEPLQPGRATEIVELPVAWSLDDFVHLGFTRVGGHVSQGSFEPARLFETTIGDFVWLTRNLDWGVVTLTLHPFIIGRGHRLLALEACLTRLIELGARFATCIDVVEAWLRR